MTLMLPRHPPPVRLVANAVAEPAPAIARPNGKAPRRGRLGTSRGSSPWHLGPDPIGCLGFTHRLSGAWQARTGDHVRGKRRSKLDLLACDPDSGYAAQDSRTRESDLAYRSLRLRDGVLATPSRSLLCVASLAHLRCAHRLG